ncbi:hypothetical protein [Pseudomonas sp. HY7a-MNA-CIBAN-0227]|uniref:hypothetical protein n=1 Tax=Pseudomonas sp. HY7a-MNA-CIBAN-0227 TaxID=3140474 RepID=UPI0033253C31
MTQTNNEPAVNKDPKTSDFLSYIEELPSDLKRKDIKYLTDKIANGETTTHWKFKQIQSSIYLFLLFQSKSSKHDNHLPYVLIFAFILSLIFAVAPGEVHLSIVSTVTALSIFMLAVHTRRLINMVIANNLIADVKNGFLTNRFMRYVIPVIVCIVPAILVSVYFNGLDRPIEIATGKAIATVFDTWVAAIMATATLLIESFKKKKLKEYLETYKIEDKDY